MCYQRGTTNTVLWLSFVQQWVPLKLAGTGSCLIWSSFWSALIEISTEAPSATKTLSCKPITNISSENRLWQVIQSWHKTLQTVNCFTDRKQLDTKMKWIFFQPLSNHSTFFWWNLQYAPCLQILFSVHKLGIIYHYESWVYPNCDWQIRTELCMNMSWDVFLDGSQYESLISEAYNVKNGVLCHLQFVLCFIT